MESPSSNQRQIVLCPLRFEMRALQKAGVAKRFDLACCGPGASGVRDWVARTGTQNRPVILAGLAGALSDRIHLGDAAAIAEVIDADSLETWRSPLVDTLAPHDSQRWRATSAKASVIGRSHKDHLHQHTGADIVDQESVAFAAAAAAAGWRWGIVRGISDDLESSLPVESDRWIDAAGRTRVRSVLAALGGRPMLLPVLWRLGRRSNVAMRAVVEVILAGRCLGP